MNMDSRTVVVNGRTYNSPRQPVVVVCIDGCEPDYLDEAIAAGQMPWLASIRDDITWRLADCVVPSFTNPNNLSIVTGRPPAVHGICGNYFLDPESGQEVMMNEPRFLRTPTIFAEMQKSGAAIAVITAKDKLRRLLGHGLRMDDGRSVCFSSEKSDTTTLDENGMENASAWLGRPVPDVYSAALSEFIFAAGVKLMSERRPDIMYLSTTDYIQHKHAPGMPVANKFYAMIDHHLAELHKMGAVIVLTADHGMNAKHDAQGQPDVIYLQDMLDARLGKDVARVILPITDPYVVHHGALGSYATAYLTEGTDVAAVLADLRSIDGVHLALTREEACDRFELPPDRTGDIVVVTTTHKVVGTRAADHDLSALKEPLRSHGGTSEQRVPLIVNRRTKNLPENRALRNFDAFDLALNFVNGQATS